MIKGTLIKDAVMNTLSPSILHAASLIRNAVEEGKQILLRFHYDADGISGALALKKAINALNPAYKFFAFQNNGAVYDKKDAMHDIALLSAKGGKALILLLDFSASEESKEALATLANSGFDILIIDHHPPADVKKYAKLFVSPWNAGGGSDYTAGMLAGEVAKNIADVEVSELQKISIAGDRSCLLRLPPEYENKATALDFLSCSKSKNPLESYERTLSDKVLFSQAYREAREKLENAKKLARVTTKMKMLGKFTVCIVRLDKIVKKGEFPSDGRACGQAHDELSSRTDSPLITIGHRHNTIAIRANSKAKEAGFSAPKIISELKSELTNAIESGGGHHVAAGIRVKEGFRKIVLEELLKKIEKI